MERSEDGRNGDDGGPSATGRQTRSVLTGFVTPVSDRTACAISSPRAVGENAPSVVLTSLTLNGVLARCSDEDSRAPGLCLIRVSPPSPSQRNDDKGDRHCGSGPAPTAGMVMMLGPSKALAGWAGGRHARDPHERGDADCNRADDGEDDLPGL